MYTAILDANITEETLVSKAVRGDLEAFNQLVEAYQDIAFHHALTFLNDRQLAEDVTQDSFIKAYRAIGRFRKGSFRAWLLRIVSNTSYDVLRKIKRHSILPLFPEDDDGNINDSPEWLEDPSPSVEEAVETKETGSEIYHLLNELPEIYREVITLVDIYDFEYIEAAQALKIKVGTVKSRLARARLEMRKKLKFNAEIPSQPKKKTRLWQSPTKELELNPPSQIGWCQT